MRSFMARLSQLKFSFVAVVVLVQVLLISMAAVFVTIAIDLQQKADVDQAFSIATFVKKEMSAANEEAAAATLAISVDEPFASALAAHDRDRLNVAVQPVWKQLQTLGFTQLAFHIPTGNGSDAVTFYRAHNPAQFNDSALFKPLIMKALTSKKLVTGLEQGRSGYGFRAVAPVYDGTTLVGSVATGLDLGKEFLEGLDHYYHGNWGIYNLDRGVKAVDDRALIDSIGPESTLYFKNEVPDPSILKLIKKGDYYYSRDADTQTSTLYVPAESALGDVTVIIEYVFHTDYFIKIRSIEQTGALICACGLLISGLIIFILYRAIMRPLEKLVTETIKIKNFQLDDPIEIKSHMIELQNLVEAVASMKVGLQSFRKYIPEQLVRQLISTQQEAVVSGQRKDLTVFFSDIVDFTAISERLTPNELASQLSEYLDAMTEVIVKHNGTVDKYIGDCVMAFWGAPLDMQDHALHACLAALECQKVVDILAQKWEREGKTPFKTRIGLNSGEIIVGNIGSGRRLSYTVVGDSVNLASRLESLNKEYDTRIIASQFTIDKLPDLFAYRLLDIVVVKGRTEPVPIYELVAAKGDITSMNAEFLSIFTSAVEDYVGKDWSRAKMRFSRLMERKPGDRACEIFIKRCMEYAENPPADDWAGEYVHLKK